LFDGTGSPIESADVAVENGRIVAVGSGLDGDIDIDCRGKTLLPGLFDCHVHIAWRTEDFDEIATLHRPFSYRLLAVASSLRRTLACGITTVRDASGADQGMRLAVEDRLIVGPRMQISVALLSQTASHGDYALPSGGVGPYDIPYPGMVTGVCDGVDGVLRKVREVVSLGADVVKICTTGGYMLSPADDPDHLCFTQTEVDAAVVAAGDLGRKVMAHAHGTEGIKRAVRAGVASVEHGTFMDEEAAAMMVERGTWLVPTLTTGDATETLAADPTVAATMRAKLTGVGHPELAAFRLAVDAGVKVAMGSDCPVTPHGTNLRELELMAANGFTPEQALLAATANAAELMGLDDELGTVECGKRADLVVVTGDPLRFDDLASRIELVVKDGVIVVDNGLAANAAVNVRVTTRAPSSQSDLRSSEG
jgi:imidazolonepropionase-like amidohydrolase